MKYSLLFKTRRYTDAAAAAKDLNLERAVGAFCEGEVAAYFVNTLCALPTDKETVIFRRGVIADLIAKNGLLDRLKKCCARIDRMKDDWSHTRAKASGRAGLGAGPEAALEAALSALREIAVFPGTLCSLLRDLCDTLSETGIASEGLIRLRDGAARVSSDDALGRIAKIAARFRFAAADKNEFSVCCTANEFLSLCGADIFDIADADQKKPRPIFRRKPEDERAYGGDAVDDAIFLTAAAASDLCALIADLTDGVYGAFCGLSDELLFYEGALKYVGYLKSSGLGCAEPEIPDGDRMTFEARGLRDLRLAADKMGASEIVPCDLSLTRDVCGILIRGANGAGKTTFLRSVGLAQLFAQAGLPLPCEYARISVRSGVFTQFSSAEESFVPGDAAGRFESEARAIAAIFDAASPGALVLLNETFQTTSFEEGTRGMNAVLRAFADLPAQYLFVTHLTSLFDAPHKRALRIEFDLNKHTYRKLEEQK